MEVRLVRSEEELWQVCRLRYRVYVGEMRLNIPEADHTSGVVSDALDKTARVFAAFDRECVVGTVRLNSGSDLVLSGYSSLYKMDRFGPYFPNHVSMTTRLVVASDHRRGFLGTRLARAGFTLADGSEILFDNICCHARQLAYFHRLGYRQIIPNFVLNGYGESHPLVLVLKDRDYLLKVGSPFASIVRESNDQGSVRYFREHFADHILPAA